MNKTMDLVLYFFITFVGLSVICIYSDDRKVYFKPAVIVWIKLF